MQFTVCSVQCAACRVQYELAVQFSVMQVGAKFMSCAPPAFPCNNTVKGISLHSTTLQSLAMHKTAMHSTAMHSTAMDNTAMHSTAMHSTAMHSNGMHSTAMHSTTLFCNLLHGTALNSTGLQLVLAMAHNPSIGTSHSTHT